MKSIGARLAVLYALSATLTLACLFAIGYISLENRLIHGLDLLNKAEYEQIRSHLGHEYDRMTRQEIDQRIRQTTQYASVLFYVNLHDRHTHDLFYSSNLNRQLIPDVPGKHIYDANVPGIGDLRVAEFVLHGLDVTVGTPLKPILTEMRSYLEVCAGLLVVMLIVSTAIGIALSRVVLRPVRAISETANRIRHDNLSERIPISDVRDEISELARILNLTFDRLEASFDQIRRFSADASHELKTPLSLLRLHAEKLATDGHLSPEHEDVVVIMLDELSRLNRVIDELLFLSRAEAKAITARTAPQEPSRFLEMFEQDAVVLAEHQNKHFILAHNGQGEVAFEEGLLRQVLLNLLTNALNASPEDGVVTLRSDFLDNIWRVTVEDEGDGLSFEQRERMFDRFVRFNQSYEEKPGTGLGLAICRTIIELHGGHIYAREGLGGKGLRVMFELPANFTPTANVFSGQGCASISVPPKEPSIVT
ncbi:MAG: HAMP domain-containing protein [Alphaproteobacteria bacterium]|nr:HAMP domain-containing protein [Alphaproteobacteria bacterium]MDE2495129.1 HAMP domain-containing protein [Alphaproteobacteria bacterium]